MKLTLLSTTYIVSNAYQSTSYELDDFVVLFKTSRIIALAQVKLYCSFAGFLNRQKNSERFQIPALNRNTVGSGSPGLRWLVNGFQIQKIWEQKLQELVICFQNQKSGCNNTTRIQTMKRFQSWCRRVKMGKIQTQFEIPNRAAELG